jgi:ribonuclease HII
MKGKTVTPAPTREHEAALWAAGHGYVVGLDEVGRGCLAGPLTVAAVVLPPVCDLDGVRDSKVLTPMQRLQAAAQVRRRASAIGIGWVASWEIDELGLTLAQQRAGERALGQTKAAYTAIILDGRHNYLGGTVPVTMVTRGDQSCLAVAAAAVVAKVARDRYMTLIHHQLSGYGFASHKGYGSREHIEKLRQLGPSAYHRHSYQPVADLTRVG